MTAQLTALVRNIVGSKGERRFSAADFMPRFGPRPPQTPNKMLQLARLFNEALGGKDRTKQQEAHG